MVIASDFICMNGHDSSWLLISCSLYFLLLKSVIALKNIVISWKMPNVPIKSPFFLLKSPCSYGFPMVFLWFSYGLPPFSDGFLMVFLWFTTIFRWFSYGLPPFSDGFSMTSSTNTPPWPWPAPSAAGSAVRGRSGSCSPAGKAQKAMIFMGFSWWFNRKNGDFMGFIRETNHFTEDNGSITRKNLILEWWFNRSKYGLMRIIHIISYILMVI